MTSMPASLASGMSGPNSPIVAPIRRVGHQRPPAWWPPDQSRPTSRDECPDYQTAGKDWLNRMMPIAVSNLLLASRRLASSRIIGTKSAESYLPPVDFAGLQRRRSRRGIRNDSPLDAVKMDDLRPGEEAGFAAGRGT